MVIITQMYKCGAFNYINIKGNNTFYLNNLIIKDTVMDTLDCYILFNEQLKEDLQNIDRCIRSNLAKKNLYLKSLPIINNCLKLKLKTIKKQIITMLNDDKGNNIIYSDLIANSNVNIEVCVDKLWCHCDYYPNFIYQLKIKKITLIT